MIIQSRDFGEITVPEEELIHFPEGIYGFPEIHRYALLSEADSPVMRLQSAEGPTPCFIVFDPFALIPGYNPVVSPEAKELLELSAPEDLMCLAIAVVPEDFRKTTLNLKSPILINSKNHKAMQLVQADTTYSLRHPLFAASEV